MHSRLLNFYLIIAIILSKKFNANFFIYLDCTAALIAASTAYPDQVKPYVNSAEKVTVASDFSVFFTNQ